MTGEQFSDDIQTISPLNGESSLVTRGSVGVLSNVSDLPRQVVIDRNLMACRTQPPTEHDVLAHVLALGVPTVLKPWLR
jgi:hypothetical protein